MPLDLFDREAAKSRGKPPRGPGINLFVGTTNARNIAWSQYVHSVSVVLEELKKHVKGMKTNVFLPLSKIIKAAIIRRFEGGGYDPSDPETEKWDGLSDATIAIRMAEEELGIGRIKVKVFGDSSPIKRKSLELQRSITVRKGTGKTVLRMGLATHYADIQEEGGIVEGAVLEIMTKKGTIKTVHFPSRYVPARPSLYYTDELSREMIDYLGSYISSRFEQKEAISILEASYNRGVEF